MRLRLRIERNALPPAQAIWPIKDGKATIAQLLQAVNDVFPLEADTWGLEDYTVSVAGFECLHYHEIATACRDEDEVIIKPLQYVDVRSRALTGRNQIAVDGRHLVDGVPFGRPLLRGVVRPEISIPPRKKRRLSKDERGVEGGDEAGALMLTAGAHDVNDEDDDDSGDEDFEAGAPDSEASSADVPSDSDDAESDSESDSESGDASSESSDSAVIHKIARETYDSDSWDGVSSSENSITPRKTAVKSNSMTETQPTVTAAPTSKKRKRTLSEGDIAENAEAQAERSSDSGHQIGLPDAESGESGHSMRNKPVSTQQQGIPYEGKSETQRRNARRRDSKKLKHLKEKGVLPRDATKDTLRSWQEQQDAAVVASEQTKTQRQPLVQLVVATSDHKSSDDTSDDSSDDISAMISDAVSDVSDDTSDISSDSSSADEDAQVGAGQKQSSSKVELQEQRHRLLSEIAAGGIDVSVNNASAASVKPLRKSAAAHPKPATLDADADDGAPPETSSKIPPADFYTTLPTPSQNVTDKATAMLAQSDTPRSRLDLAGSKRLLFGSLGVRVPKTQEDKDRLQKKLAERPRMKPLHAETESVPTVADAPAINGSLVGTQAEDVDWRAKLNLTAVECCDEGVDLSTPPFPFEQYWDKQYSIKRSKRRSQGPYMESSRKKHKANGENAEYSETYDKYNIDGHGDALDYDEAVEEDVDEEYWEEGALLDNKSGDDGDEFPQLPDDITKLPVLGITGVHMPDAGDYIVFSELACDATTKWQPKTMQRTALILSLVSNGEDVTDCVIKFAPRDLAPEVLDEEGNRIYSRFEVPESDSESDDHDSAVRDVQWNDLGVVRLLGRQDHDKFT